MQKHQSRHFQESQEEHPEVRYQKEKSLKRRRELLANAKTAGPTHRGLRNQRELENSNKCRQVQNSGMDRKELVSYES